ncbi:MAG: arginine--tRNA ligase [Lachnospiraceae bacterium]|nr:arginine--tRNA ligase [Lachnospiraceae bacterium]
MKKLMELLREEMVKAFAGAGYDEKYAQVNVSNRPDLCQYQCNGALAAAKAYHKAPMVIAEEVVPALLEGPYFEKAEAVRPGFINLTLRNEFLADYVNEMAEAEKFGAVQTEEPRTIMIDYGGPNVAKPLHVGHLRSAVIGESVKRICRFVGHKVIGDVHLGDWGLQMGLIITELRKRQPDLPYFDPEFAGEYPEEAPFTIGELEEIYPYANAFSKEHPEYLAEAHQATYELQNGNRGYLALWQHIINVSVTDLKRNYRNLNVEFDLWKKESDAQKYIPDLVKYLKDEGYAYISEGALVVDVKEETDTKEIPPCMILKSDGATLYNTTDLATIVEREKLFDPDTYIYVVDKRQGLYFEQIFRCAKKCKLVPEETEMIFLGFGTMNGKDGKPSKTRDGGVMRLENLIAEIKGAVYDKIMENRQMDESEADEVARKVGVAALKYGDLSNQASKDYIFDTERFTSFDGNTGPYILYTIVRIKSILQKYREMGGDESAKVHAEVNPSELALLLQLGRFSEMVQTAYEEKAPHKVCQYVYELANAFNGFYHETRILNEEDTQKRAGYIALLKVVLGVLETCCDLLGIETPDRM